MLDVLTIGELLIDFICPEKGLSLVEAVNFTKKAGGAPANVAVGVAKLSGKSGFIGKVGNDPFGEFLIKTLKDHNVDVSYLLKTDESRTSLAFVSIKADGDRDFTFFREPGADNLLRFNEISLDYLANTKIFHFGSISLIQDPIKTTVKKCLNYLKKRKVLISYDPNLRLSLWKSKEKALNGIKEGLKYADILKISEEELIFITGIKDYEKGIKLLHDYGIKLIFLTLGKNGSMVSSEAGIVKIDPFKVKTVDTTGAGDGFMAGALYELSKLKDFDNEIRNIETIKNICYFANKVGAIVTTEYGAISALPTLEKVNSFKEME